MSRNVRLTSIAGGLRNQGLDEDAIYAGLLDLPERNGLPEPEVRAIANSIGKRKIHARHEPEPGRTFADSVEELAMRRGWRVEALRRLGAEPHKNEVRFPMRDAYGETVGWRRRRSDNQTFDSGPKALAVKGSKNGLICPWPFPGSDPVLVTEGEADAAAAISAGHLATVGTPGANPGQEVLKSLQRLLTGRRVLLCPDPDNVGYEWLEIVGSALSNARCTVHFVPALNMDLDKRLSQEPNPTIALECLLRESLPFVRESLPFTQKKGTGPQESCSTLEPCDEKGSPIPLHVARRILSQRHTLVSAAGEFWEFSGKVFEKVAFESLDRDALNLISVRAHRSNLGDIRHLLGVECFVSPDFFERERGNLIAVENGMLDVQTLELLNHGPEYRCRNLLPVDFEPAADCPRFHQALEEWFPGDPQTQSTLCEWLGWCLIPDVSLERILILVGEGANGKGRFVRVLENLLGKHNVAGVPLTALRTERTFPAAALVGKLVNLCPEAESTGAIDEGFVKCLVSGDTVQVERKNRDPFEFRNTARFVLQTNNPPRVHDKSDGFWRRLLTVPFAQTFAEDKRDRDLDKKLALEMPGILNMAIEGLQKLRERGRFEESPVMTKAREDYRRDCNPLLSWVEERVEPIFPDSTGRSCHVATLTLYEDYQRWCSENGHAPYARKRFTQEIKKALSAGDTRFLDPTGRQCRGFQGYRLVRG